MADVTRVPLVDFCKIIVPHLEHALEKGHELEFDNEQVKDIVVVSNAIFDKYMRSYFILNVDHEKELMM